MLIVSGNQIWEIAYVLQCEEYSSGGRSDPEWKHLSKAYRAKPCPKLQIPSNRTSSNGTGESGAQQRQGRSISPVPT